MQQKKLKRKEKKEMFSENIRIHHMEMRNSEKYLVQHANTERLKKSAIIYMQNLLNKNEYN